MKRKVLEPFDAAGISADRIDFLGAVDRNEYLMGYNEVDIILDTFPYMGGTTTAEALFMGTPVVARHGSDFASRIGLSILQTAGFGDWATKADSEYVETAIGLAQASCSGMPDKRNVRDQVLRSRLFDKKQFTQSFVDSLNKMMGSI